MKKIPLRNQMEVLAVSRPSVVTFSRKQSRLIEEPRPSNFEGYRILQHKRKDQSREVDRHIASMARLENHRVSLLKTDTINLTKNN
jgi:hypothetical protein